MCASFETPDFRVALGELMRWRRDVRRFRPDPVPEPDVAALLQAAALAPSVGLSQPWRFVRMRSEAGRCAVRATFEACNTAALAGYEGEDAALYTRLKLAGLDEAPVQFAVFSDHATRTGRGLGRQTMPETLDYSVVMAIHNLWLLARAQGVGVGWVSILQPTAVIDVVKPPPGWRFIAYLCLGYPADLGLEPELQREGWERRLEIQRFVSEC